MFKQALLVAVVFCANALADPPALKLPAEVHGNSTGFIVVTAETPAKSVKWVPIDTGLSLLPPALLRDSKSAVLMAPKGRYRLLAYCAVGDDPSEPAIVTVIVDGAVTPPPIDNPPDKPVDPPPVSGQVWAVVVQPDGPLTPALAQNRKDPAWQRLAGKVQLSWIEASQVDASFRADVASVKLPALFVLKVVDGKSKLLSKQTLPSAAEAVAIVEAQLK